MSELLDKQVKLLRTYYVLTQKAENGDHLISLNKVQERVSTATGVSIGQTKDVMKSTSTSYKSPSKVN